MRSTAQLEAHVERRGDIGDDLVIRNVGETEARLISLHCVDAATGELCNWVVSRPVVRLPAGEQIPLAISPMQTLKSYHIVLDWVDVRGTRGQWTGHIYAPTAGAE